MKQIVIPAILTLIGTGAGIGAGLALQPKADDPAIQITGPCGEPGEESQHSINTAEPDIGPARDYARLNNQFVVPILENGRVAALVVMSLNVEVRPGTTATVFATEPKLRDGFLQNMFDHANMGGFSGNFTQASNMRSLRNDLLQTARRIIGSDVTDVLIMDIVRQDS